MAKFKEGQKIKCIDYCFIDSSTNPFKARQLKLPKRGKIYTIRNIVRTEYGSGLRLEELRNRKFYFGDVGRYEEPIFDEERFESI